MWTAPVATFIGLGIGLDQEKFGKGMQICAHHLSGEQWKNYGRTNIPETKSEPRSVTAAPALAKHRHLQC